MAIAENLLTERYVIPISARPREHYKKVFPEVFTHPMGQTLVVGPGLSNVVLHSKIIAIDPGFANSMQMTEEFFQNPANRDHLGKERATLAYLRRIKLEKETNYNIIAGEAGPLVNLPFPKHYFENIISSNCVFGGLDLELTPEQITALILKLDEHLSFQGTIQLFPYLAEKPETLTSLEPNELALYAKAFSCQQITTDLLQNQGLKLSSQDTSVRHNRSPHIFQTLTIHI